jgi:hypothetical protein
VGRMTKVAAVFVFLWLAYIGSALALDDGFGSSEEAQGQYFTIYYKPQVDIGLLLSNLNVGSIDKIMVGKSAENQAVSSQGLGGALDTLFLQVADMLDMHVYSFHGKIKVCRDYTQLSRIYRDFFGRDLNTQSFYTQELNTIYISEENFKRQILGHEIAHAIMSSYFVVSPSVKVH